MTDQSRQNPNKDTNKDRQTPSQQRPGQGGQNPGQQRPGQGDQNQQGSKDKDKKTQW